MKALSIIIVLTASASLAQTPQYSKDGRFLLLPIEQVPIIATALTQLDSCQAENKRFKATIIESNRDIIEIDSLYRKSKAEREEYLKQRDIANAKAFKLEIRNAEIVSERPKKWVKWVYFGLGVATASGSVYLAGQISK